MNVKKQKPQSDDSKKDAGNNNWTNNNTKFYPNTRERRDGPGGEDGNKK